ncbi:MAG: 2-oxoglutarate dehydrogenase, E2 component, dihydrolipoamide succinyltransferase [Luteitalea sp.]|nr:2-oxoglutarate dehydrogenase, E2 component, dihydrolipoamide succinyltransferase [Luteitalea sp.]
MPTNVVMPQMGESVAEGTVTRWIKQIGEPVDRDEPLFEISTDKVDAEIPSPAAGVLAQIRVKEGETVPVDTVVGVIAAAGEQVGSNGRGDADQRQAGTEQPDDQTDVAASAATETEAQAGRGDVATRARPKPEPVPLEAERERLRRQKSSPLVRKIAREHSVEIAEVSGTGVSGRVTKADILKFIDERRKAPAPAAAGVALPHIPAYAPGEVVDVVPMSVMRKKIAEHMVLSRRTSAHVHSVFEVDFTRVAKIRDDKKADYERASTKLTFLSFIAKAIVDALRAMPILNASVDGDKIVYKRAINLGIAVALDWGLIVPVIQHADEKNLLGLSRAIQDLAVRARNKQLKPEEVQSGTFTITNPGTFGTLFGMPIINQPQVAILGVGAIEKRVAVIDDALAIRQRAYLTLGYDHRLVDGAAADQFMQIVKQRIETFEV